MPETIQPSFLGFDFSTQQIKCVCTDEGLSVIATYHVTFDQDVPEYETSGGVNSCVDEVSGRERVWASPLMWMHALDLLLTKMRHNAVDFSRVKSLSGCGQMHGTVYWNNSAQDSLAHLDSTRTLVEQLGQCLAVQKSPVWVDSSTTEQCAEMEAVVGGPQQMAKISGSKAYERFCGPQIKYIHKYHKEQYDNTLRISIVSSFACSLFVGTFAPIDLGDASGTNLLNTSTLDWEPQLLEVCAPQLADKLGKPVPSYTNVGKIAKYFRERYGFSESCSVATFTGDNCASVEGLRARQGDLVVSCGTSDNLIFLGENLQASVYGHLFITPLQLTRFCFNLCYKNGSLVREEFQRHFCDSSWHVFEQMLAKTPVGNDGFIGLFYSKPEHIPQNGFGKFLFDASDIPVEKISVENELRALVEGQFLMKRVHLEKLAGFSSIQVKPRILLTGGAARNKGLCQVIADVYDGNVFYLDMPNAAALGNAYRAKFSLNPSQNYDDMFSSECEQFQLICSPRPGAVATYKKMLPRFARIEKLLFGSEI